MREYGFNPMSEKDMATVKQSKITREYAPATDEKITDRLTPRKRPTEIPEKEFYEISNPEFDQLETLLATCATIRNRLSKVAGAYVEAPQPELAKEYHLLRKEMADRTSSSALIQAQHAVMERLQTTENDSELVKGEHLVAEAERALSGKAPWALPPEDLDYYKMVMETSDTDKDSGSKPIRIFNTPDPLKAVPIEVELGELPLAPPAARHMKRSKPPKEKPTRDVSTGLM